VTKPNPENCNNRSSKCAYDCAQLQYTIQLMAAVTQAKCHNTAVKSLGTTQGQTVRWQSHQTL